VEALLPLLAGGLAAQLSSYGGQIAVAGDSGSAGTPFGPRLDFGGMDQPSGAIRGSIARRD